MDWTTIIAAALASGTILEIAKFIIRQLEAKQAVKTAKKQGGTFEDKMEKAVADVNTKLDNVIKSQERDHRGLIRMQLIDFIDKFPGKEDEILNLAKEYFEDLGGNRQAVTVFQDWWKEHHIKNDFGEYDYPEYLVAAYKKHYNGRDIYEDDKKED